MKSGRRDALILMTALPPTLGHVDLISFAHKFMSESGGYNRGCVDVMISGRDHEPMNVWERRDCLYEHFRGTNGLFFHVHEDNNAPQIPPGTPDGDKAFWDYWINAIKRTTGHVVDYAYVFASEEYGKTLANVIGAEFIPYDIDRTIRNISGTEVRKNLIKNWNQIIPSARRRLTTTITVFGQESTGKTTLVNRIGKEFPSMVRILPEWARPYLEQVGETLSDEKMLNIAKCQSIIERMVLDDPPMIVVKDTDLLSTLGYYEIYNDRLAKIEIPHILKKSILHSDLYIVMNDKIPFAADPLRYGGDKRESTMRFWIDMLAGRGLEYHVMQATDPDEQFVEATEVILKKALTKTYELVTFNRD